MAQNRKTDSTVYFDFILIDFLSLLISFAASYVIKFHSFDFVRSETWLPLLYIVLLLNVVIGVFSDPYKGILQRPYYEEIVHSLLLSFYNLLATGIIFYVFKIGVVFSRQMILTTYGLYFLLSLVLKCLWKKLILSRVVHREGEKKSRLLVVADADRAAQTVHNAAAGDFAAYEIRGAVLTDSPQAEVADGVPVMPFPEDFAGYVLSHNIDEVLIAVSPERIAKEDYRRLVSGGVSVHFDFESTLGFDAEDYEVGRVGAAKTISLRRHTFSPGQKVYLCLKRVLDIFVSLVGCVFLLPVTAAVKAASLASGDKAPIFYRQNRIGKDGRQIRIYKFRSMVPDADSVLKELLKDEVLAAQWQANQKLNDDPRITKVGRVLRKTSVDELPQLINVLKGDMSLVGPRPLVAGELESHGGMKLYQQLKPGITGWWGCNGRSNIDYHERLELEYYYVKNVSAYLDFLCVLRTVLTVLKREGAE